jgi:hypothetical protein
LRRLHQEGDIDLPAKAKEREAAGNLLAIGAVRVSPDRKVRLAEPALLTESGEIDAAVLRLLLRNVPGGREGMAVLDSDPRATPLEVGTAISEAAHANWTRDTTRGVGGYFRSWARLAGSKVEYPKRTSKVASP